jgi:hypothetical protein
MTLSHSTPLTFHYAQTALRRQRQFTWIFAGILGITFLAIAIYGWITMPLFGFCVAIGFLSVAILMVCGMILSTRSTEAEYSAMQLMITNEALYRFFRGVNETVPWHTITRVRVTRTPQHRVQAIHLSVSGKRAIRLVDFDQLDQLWNAIDEQLAPTITREERVQHWFTTRPFIAVVAASVLVTLYFIIKANAGMPGLNLFLGVVHIVLGGYNLWKRPLAQQNPNFGRLELFGGLGFLGLGLMRILNVLFP